MLCHCVPLSIFSHVCWVVVTPTVKPYLDKSLWTREMFQTGNVKQKQRDPVRRLLLARDVCRFAKCCLLASWLILAKDVEPLNVFSSNCSSLVTECSICYTMYTMSMDCILMSHKMSLCNVHVIDVLANVSVVNKNCLLDCEVATAFEQAEWDCLQDERAGAQSAFFFLLLSVLEGLFTTVDSLKDELEGPENLFVLTEVPLKQISEHARCAHIYVTWNWWIK